MMKSLQFDQENHGDSHNAHGENNGSFGLFEKFNSKQRSTHLKRSSNTTNGGLLKNEGVLTIGKQVEVSRFLTIMIHFNNLLIWRSFNFERRLQMGLFRKNLWAVKIETGNLSIQTAEIIPRQAGGPMRNMTSS